MRSAIVFIVVLPLLATNLLAQEDAIPLTSVRLRMDDDMGWDVRLNDHAFMTLLNPASQITDEQRSAMSSLQRYFNEGSLGVFTKKQYEEDLPFHLGNEIKKERAAEVQVELKQILGDQWNEVIYGLNRKHLKRKFDNDRTYLTSDDLAFDLGLDNYQKKVIAAASEEFSSNFRSEQLRLNDQLAQLRLEHYESLIAELNRGQRSKYEDAVGSWFDWKPVPVNAREKPIAAGGGQVEVDEPDAEPSQPEVFNHELLQLLQSGVVDAELELTDDQRDKLNEFKRRNFRKVEVQDAKPRRKSELLEGKFDLPEELSEIYLPHQLDRLRQIELQIHLEKFESSFGLLDSATGDYLNLTNSQQKSIAGKTTEYENARKVLLSTRAAANVESNQKAIVKMFSILTMEQQLLYQRILGPVE